MQAGFFDRVDRLSHLETRSDLSLHLDSNTKRQAFLPLLMVIHQKQRKSNAGGKPCDGTLMFKIPALQSLHELTGDQTKFLFRSRLLFQRFSQLSQEDTVPDTKTPWMFRERLARQGMVEKLFPTFFGTTVSIRLDDAQCPDPLCRRSMCRTTATRGTRTERPKADALTPPECGIGTD